MVSPFAGIVGIIASIRGEMQWFAVDKLSTLMRPYPAATVFGDAGEAR
jgi:hypothetical protein